MEVDLIKLWGLGLSANGVRKEINYKHAADFSRSAVVGKISRMRKAGHPLEEREAPIKAKEFDQKRKSRLAARARLVKEAAMKDQQATEENPLFSEVREKQCRYPLWTDSTPPKERRVCGSKTTKTGASLCEEHHARCWYKERKRPQKGGLSKPTIKAIISMSMDGVPVEKIARVQAVTLEQAQYYSVRR